MYKLSNIAAAFLLGILLLMLHGCSSEGPASSQPHEAEPEAIARTEFSDRVENFFEYEPLQAGKPSQFRIHLTDLSDGAPV
jgi:hypothetical protein